MMAGFEPVPMENRRRGSARDRYAIDCAGNLRLNLSEETGRTVMRLMGGEYTGVALNDEGWCLLGPFDPPRKVSKTRGRGYCVSIVRMAPKVVAALGEFSSYGLRAEERDGCVLLVPEGRIS